MSDVTDAVATEGGLGRRRFLQGVGGAAAVAMIGGLGATGCEPTPHDAHGLKIVAQETFGRIRYFRFQTANIGWNPGVNVWLPDGYANSGIRYPVLYWLHGGLQDFTTFDDDIRAVTAGKKIIVVAPDGGGAGWYCNPVSSLAGPRNWESFHMSQLLPWVDACFRTHAEYSGRAVAGFSMGGFGALKYAAKYYGHFASVSSHSGPASLRRDNGLVVHWANTSAAAAELNGGSVYGVPWNEARVSADNPMERRPSYRDKRVFMVCGNIDDINETPVRAGMQEFSWHLNQDGIAHQLHILDGGHFVRRHMLQQDVDGMIARLKKAA